MCKVLEWSACIWAQYVFVWGSFMWGKYMMWVLLVGGVYIYVEFVCIFMCGCMRMGMF